MFTGFPDWAVVQGFITDFYGTPLFGMALAAVIALGIGTYGLARMLGVFGGRN